MAQIPQLEYLNHLIKKAQASNLANQRYWHLLLHYRTSFLGGYRSEADGLGFFLSDRGKFDPKSELEATLLSFFNPLPQDPNLLHPQCKFPARYAWLKAQLGFDSEGLPEQPCERFRKWQSRLNTGSVTIIFASAYFDNPASMYGHTFLRFNRKDHSEGERLLDYTANFAAITDTESGILFAINGLLGGYTGAFSTLPYYVKVQEYSNIQSRDLWEYHLNLNATQINRLEMHLWEMGATHFDYYFLTENCSYQLLPLLEVAEPSFHLTDGWWFGIIPIDTIRSLLKQPGLVSKVEHRPSHLKKMLQKRSLLSKKEKELAHEIAVNQDQEKWEKFESLPENRKVMVLDSALDFFRFKEGFGPNLNRGKKSMERQMLIKRSKLTTQAKQPFFPQEGLPPDQGHRSGRIGLGFGFSKDDAFEEISLRLAFHDLAANQTGYTPDSQLAMGHLRLRFDNSEKKPFIEKLTLIEIISLSPWDPWIQKPSWKVWTGMSLAKELGCNPRKCLFYGLNGGRGITFKTHFWKGETLYFMGEADVGVGGIFRENFRLGGGGRSGLLLNLASFWRLHFEGVFLRYPLGDKRPNNEYLLTQSFFVSKNTDLRVTLLENRAYREAVLYLNIYF